MAYKDKIIILDIPDDIDDDRLAVLAFMVKMATQDRIYTGYKEIKDAGIDLDYFLEVTDTKVNRRGAVRIDMTFIRHFVARSSKNVSRYYLDTDIFEYDYNVFGAFKRRDPVWFTPDEEYNKYDEEMFNALPEELKGWFIRKIKKGIITPAQELLEYTYNKYVVKGEPVLSATN